MQELDQRHVNMYTVQEFKTSPSSISNPQLLNKNTKVHQLGWLAMRRRQLMEGVWSMMALAIIGFENVHLVYYNPQ